MAVLIGLRHGARKDETLSMLWDKVDLEAGSFELWSTKNKRWRWIPMTSDVKEALRLLKEVTGDRKFLFPKRKDSKSSHLAATTFDKNWADVKALAGIKTRLRFHDLRHECASRLGDIGMPHKAACELLDMSIKTFNDIYSKSNMEVKERWIRIMEREY